ncbi:LOW QUALITY PROTEIN: hypothetical protein SETIT_7G172400v2 [Setaria italica]|uniref:VWFA domain-containing protein n=1 Tax=Setaria italica TaxID=4555 RepID=A0A368RWL3_SETIT|nr:LOW QUALITY PROTEIN: hypothetical protein SETIT_7G172400v2 [Setaria italica]
MAECSPTFHFRCISTYAPLLRTPRVRRQPPGSDRVSSRLPLLRRRLPLPPPPGPSSSPTGKISPLKKIGAHLLPEEAVISDRESFCAMESASVAHGHFVCPLCNAPWRSCPSGTLVVKTHTECSAIARNSSHDNLDVLVHVRAPGMIGGEATNGRAGTRHHEGGKARAAEAGHVGFVIDNLGPHDCLCVVSFSDTARSTRLPRMSDTGKGPTTRAVASLAARGGTDIAEGIRKAAKVLDERRQRNAVSSVILLSDGQDTRRAAAGPNYGALVPPSFAPFARADTGDWSAPIHTFGFGNNHDAAAMHVVAEAREATGGTFSFMEDEAVIKDVFAQCIGGLLSVVVQEARVRIACLHAGVGISAVRSGRYESRIDDDGRAASVAAGELYADEELRFLQSLAVPRADDATETTLIGVACGYRDAAGGADVNVTAADTVVARPEHAVGAGAERSMEVERERVCVEATADIARRAGHAPGGGGDTRHSMQLQAWEPGRSTGRQAAQGRLMVRRQR